MKKIILFTCLMACSWSMLAQSQNQTYLDYIATYRDMAIEQQRKYNVPAAITMAQGILESAAGQSELAKKAKNHFGVKCTSDWVGRTYYKDDDQVNSCFRVYAEVSDSYEDHSLFLTRKRYESLFALPIGDYKNWAYGLKACGYATDPHYPEKLIRIIEQYGLNELTFDTLLVRSGAVNPQDTTWQEGDIQVDFTALAEDMPTPEMQDLQLFHNYQSGRCNGVRFIIAGPNETYASLASFLNMYERTLRKYNDALDGRELQEGDIVYIYAKKNRASRKTPYCYFREGDTAWSIAQRYGIKMKSLYKLNGIPYGVPLTTYQKLILR